ncbi:glycerophosphodiester phosphodiesterase [Nocardioides houyundeii]|uniref:glycerophosphodiester phosphodiesterase n=1 Tax=Nocardioides houyundeii TaxID=2045452 RepID=UPI000C785CFA|nr:glycerophosphodiester phosphodiesterase [Nocardioides houyundeii]
MTLLAIAHRAGNSLAGLEAANQLGVDVVECDIHQYRGNLEVRHLKTAGPLPFLWDRWQLASASAPRLGLAALLAADRHGTTFMLDLKGRRTAAARAVARLLRDLGHDAPILVCGRHWPSVELLAEEPQVLPVLSARNRGELRRLLSRLEDGSRVHGVSVHRDLLDAGTVARLSDLVEVVMTWSVNDLESLDRMRDLGVTGIISDEPTVLAQLLAERPDPGPRGSGS